MTKQITNSMKILFIADNSIFSNIAYRCVQNFCPNTEGMFWEHGDIPFPEIDNWKGDIILSFKADVVLSARILKNASTAAVNFHPAPPNYRGVGTYSWAIRNKEKIYGVTCHHIIEKIDFGKIIAVRYFPILKGETATSLKMRAGIYCLYLLNEILPQITEGKELPVSQESWRGRLYTYEDLNILIKETGVSSSLT
jgi:methionyl-tRNA formyltransferase